MKKFNTPQKTNGFPGTNRPSSLVLGEGGVQHIPPYPSPQPKKKPAYQVIQGVIALEPLKLSQPGTLKPSIF